jgi:hypothetical protein
MNDLSEQPRDPRKLLSEHAQRRIGKAFTEGSKTREAAHLAHRADDPESELELCAASFSFALLVLAVKSAELRYAGIRGHELGEILSHEIEAAANSLELGDAGEHYLGELLLTDWGW